MQAYFYFLPLILTLGAFTSYTDIKFRKIKNKHLLYCFFASIPLYVYLLTSNKINLNINLLLNPLIGLAIGFLLFLTYIWGAGDAKLFFLYSLLVNSDKYSDIIPCPSLVLFINVFLVSFLIITLVSLKNIFQRKQYMLKALFSAQPLQAFFYTFLIVFTVAWPLSYLNNWLTSRINIFTLSTILYLSYLSIYWLLEKLRRKNMIYLLALLGLILRLIFDFRSFSLFVIGTYLKTTAALSLIFYIINTVFNAIKTEEKDSVISFAPLMFLGALAVNTNLIFLIMNFFNFFRK